MFLTRDDADRAPGLRGRRREDCADRIGVHWIHVQKIEYGTVNVTVRTLARLCAGFGAAAHDLVCRKRRCPREPTGATGGC